MVKCTLGGIMRKCFFTLPFLWIALLWGEPSPADVFTRVYETGLWGKDEQGNGTSGSGSTLENATEYIVFLNKFIQRNQIKTVVDIGCGDWEVMKHVDLSGVEYIGVDVVPSIIQRNIEKYASSHVHFIVADCIQDPLPKADLLLCKDVFNHLPNDLVFKVIDRFRNYRHILVTTDVEAATLTSGNGNIVLGDWRSIDLSAPPFFQKGKKVLIYPAEYTYYHLKQVFYIDRQNAF